MGRRRDEWVEVFQALGEAFFAVLSAEWEVLRREWWRGSVRRLLLAVALFFAAACFFVMLVALVVTAAVEIVALWLEPWQATLVVAAAVLLVVLAFAGAGYLYLKRLENPVATARARLADHLDWWRERLLGDERALPEGDEHGEDGDENSRTPE